jgi:hypothetical protein
LIPFLCLAIIVRKFVKKALVENLGHMSTDMALQLTTPSCCCGLLRYLAKKMMERISLFRSTPAFDMWLAMLGTYMSYKLEFKGNGFFDACSLVVQADYPAQAIE